MPETKLETKLIRVLSEGSGIEFVRDAWIDENNDLGQRDYGVVTVDGSPAAVWADDRLVYQRITGSVILYVMDGDDRKARRVQDILRGLDISFRLQEGGFVRELTASRWHWVYTMEGYFREPEEAIAEGGGGDPGDGITETPETVPEDPLPDTPPDPAEETEATPDGE